MTKLRAGGSVLKYGNATNVIDEKQLLMTEFKVENVKKWSGSGRIILMLAQETPQRQKIETSAKWSFFTQ